jgi:phosphate:Na+ symporter
VQAAALVIGMDVGTTVKSLIATLGGGRDMRRTAAAHVGYNIVTAAVALLLLGFVPLLPAFIGGDETTALVVFHTLFNVSGVVLLLPFAGAFARLIERIVPGGRGALPEPLDRALMAEPEAALDAARSAAGQIAATVFRRTAAELRAVPVDSEDPHRAIEDLEEFLTDLAVPIGREGPRNRLSALLHLTDHLHRFQHRAGQAERIDALARDPALRRPARALALALDRAATAPADAALAARLGRLNRMIAGRTARLRRSVLLREHVGLVSQRDVFALTDALRWLERVAAHAERIVHYGATAAQERPAKEDARTGG